MISIVTAYHNREKQLLKTLESFSNYEDIELILVNDSEPVTLPLLPFDVTMINIRGKNWINPGVNFNIGFNEALKHNPDAILIQNPECYHVGDIISAVKENLTSDNYLSFACYSLGKDQDITFRSFDNRTAVSNGDSAWYNHSKYRPEALHFCAAITPSNLRKINGFDEQFAHLLGYEDNFFIHQVKTVGLKVKFIDDPYVFHQYHYDKKAFTFDEVLYNRAGALYESLKKDRIYRSKHFITEDL